MAKVLKKRIEDDLDFLKCHIFRLSQKKWGLDKKECLNVFVRNKLFKYIEDNYEFMHMQGLDRSVKDVEKVIK